MITKPSGCSSCPLVSKGRGFVPDQIAKHADYLVYGEAPGSTEVEKGVPFQGKAGFVLKNWIMRQVPAVQIASEKGRVSYANVLRCVGYRTRVWMADGSWRQIQSIKSGEFVKCVSDGQITIQPVLAVTRAPNRHEWYQVDVDGAHRRNQHGNRGVFVTPDHTWITPNGLVRTDNLRIGDPVYLPQAGSDDFFRGCLLGDGHMRADGIFVVAHTNQDWTNAKAEHLGVVPTYARKTGGYSTLSDVWTIYCTIPKTYRDLHYTDSGSRRWSPPANAAQAAVWFGDDGSFCQNGRTIWNLNIAVHRYLPQWESAISSWAKRFGSHRINGSLYFNKDASQRFAEWIAPWLHPSMAYKLPLSLRYQYNGWLSKTSPLVGTICSVGPVKPKPEIAKHAEMCLVVAKAHNFFTRCGLVSNCLPPEIHGRAYPKGEERVQAEACCKQYMNLGDAPVVILCGDSPQRFFFGPELEAEDVTDRQLQHEVKGVMGRVGRVYERDGKRWIFAPHPAYILRQPAMVEHGQRAFQIASGTERVLEPQVLKWEHAMQELI